MVSMLGFHTESLEVENSCVFWGRRLEESRSAYERRKRGWGEVLPMFCVLISRISQNPSALVEPAGCSQELLRMSSVAVWVRKGLDQML